MIRQAFSIQNDNIINSGQEISLVLSFSLKGFNIFLFAESDKSVIKMDDFFIETPDPGTSNFQDTFSNLINEYIVNSGNIKSLYVILNCSDYTPVPSDLFVEDEKDKLFNFVLDKPVQHTENYEIITESDKIQLLCQNWTWQRLCIENLERNLIVNNDITLFAKSVLNSPEFQNGTYVYVSSNYFDVLVMENNKLLLLNRFSFATSKDFCYYLIASIKYAGLDPSRSNLFLAGEILPDSEISALISKYISNIEFLEIPGIQIPEEIVPHRYFIQFSLL